MTMAPMTSSRPAVPLPLCSSRNDSGAASSAPHSLWRGPSCRSPASPVMCLSEVGADKTISHRQRPARLTFRLRNSSAPPSHPSSLPLTILSSSSPHSRSPEALNPTMSPIRTNCRHTRGSPEQLCISGPPPQSSDSTSTSTSTSLLSPSLTKHLTSLQSFLSAFQPSHLATAVAGAAVCLSLLHALPPSLSSSAAAAAATMEPASSLASSAAGGSQLYDAIFESSVDDFQTGIASSFLLVLFSEIGDKTFFIAALLSMRRPGAEVFAGTFGALAVMTVVSVLLGRTFHLIDDLVHFQIGGADIPLDDVAAAVLLVYFGLSTLRDATGMDDSAAEDEVEEAAQAVEALMASPRSQQSASSSSSSSTAVGATSSGESTTGKSSSSSSSIIGGSSSGGSATTSGGGSGDAISLASLVSVFTLVFLAEWGDKSFFSTIALAAASSPLGVIFGSVAAHGLATAIAVIGGSVLSQYISEKLIAYVGGSLFLVFAAFTIFEIIDKVAA